MMWLNLDTLGYKRLVKENIYLDFDDVLRQWQKRGDSMIVLLGWITNTEPWNTFVGNRVKEEIQTHKNGRLRFVPGEMLIQLIYPRDHVRWFELLRSRWWEGPKWLYEPPEFWPYTEINLPEEYNEKNDKVCYCES
ncbi:uncharacterized protein CDAR_240401 [Caerostris darwini]|uniref:Uncharacterized protein n=1 Tax=Caerostris darwini TaxID=1538125 RepID=A0AAV4RN30_9ARAC|nr:uncharacterized protein CDAR_240401 [Caerostris darwini]